MVQNNLCGLGGDLFALIKCGSSKVTGVNGSGRAGQRATIDFYKSKNKEIPSRGPLAALTVPGIVHAWGEIAKKYATMELDDLLKPAIEYSESGFPLTQKYVDSIKATSRVLGDTGGWSGIFAPGEVIPQPGALFKQKDLSATLRAISEEGAESYYKGSLMEKIVSGIREGGGILETEDFQTHTTTWEDPMKTNYRGVDVYETAPNSQGATALLWLNMLEHYDLKSLSADSKGLLRLYLETGLKAYEERAKWITDPSYNRLPEEFASKEHAEEVLASSPQTVQSVSPITPGGDTTYFAVADSEGNCASVIQSNYMGFGSGLVPRGTGFVLQNRGCYFSLDPSHHNALFPGKRTFHTICASLGEREGRTLFALGLMGGDIQPQVHVQLMTKILDFGMDVQAAIDSPRWVFPGTIYEKPSALLLEEDLARVLTDFRFEGLRIETLSGYSSQTGHAQAVFLNAEGGLSGGADPRGDGAAVGF